MSTAEETSAVDAYEAWEEHADRELASLARELVHVLGYQTSDPLRLAWGLHVVGGHARATAADQVAEVVRRRKRTWTEVGRVFGLSKTGAFSRFGGRASVD